MIEPQRKFLKYEILKFSRLGTACRTSITVAREGPPRAQVRGCVRSASVHRRSSPPMGALHVCDVMGILEEIPVSPSKKGASFWERFTLGVGWQNGAKPEYTRGMIRNFEFLLKSPTQKRPEIHRMLMRRCKNQPCRKRRRGKAVWSSEQAQSNIPPPPFSTGKVTKTPKNRLWKYESIE